MRKVLYAIPYFYDAADEAWPVKYLNDLPCSFSVKTQRTQPDGHTPIDGDVEVSAEDGVHAILQGYDDVTVLADAA